MYRLKNTGVLTSKHHDGIPLDAEGDAPALPDAGVGADLAPQHRLHQSVGGAQQPAHQAVHGSALYRVDVLGTV